MKRIVIVSLLLLPSLKMLAQEIRFEQNLSWSQIKEKARSESKFIFVDAYATWCGPCRRMDQEVFKSPQVAAFFNQHFISVKAQIDSTAKDNDFVRSWYKDADSLKKAYTINSFPSFIFLSPQAQPVHKSAGFQSAEQLISDGMVAIGERGGYYSGLERYKSGQQGSSAGIRQLATYAKAMGDNQTAEEIGKTYTIAREDEELLKEENLKFLGEFCENKEQFGFKKLQALQPKIILLPNGYLYLKPMVETVRKISGPMVAGSKHDKTLATLERQMIARFGVAGRIAIWHDIALHYYIKKDIQNFVRFKIKMLNNYPEEISTFTLCNDAWFVFQNTGNRQLLKEALKWSETVRMKEPDETANLDTYANILYRLGRIDEAINVEREALRLAPNDIEIQKSLKKMLAGKPTWLVLDEKEDQKH